MDSAPLSPLERAIRAFGVIGLVVVAGLAGWRLLILEAELARLRVDATHQLAETRKAQSHTAAQLEGMTNRLKLLTAEPAAPQQPAPSPTAESEALRTRLAAADKRISGLEKQLARLRDQDARKTRVYENERRMLRAGQAALEAEKKELTRRLADVARRAATEAIAAAEKKEKQGPSIEGKPLDALIARLNEQMGLADRRTRLRLISAKRLRGGAFEGAELEQRDGGGRLVQRVQAARAVVELYQKHRLLRVRLETAHRRFGPASARPGSEMRLPALVLELYDVDVKGWRELFRETQSSGWLELR